MSSINGIKKGISNGKEYILSKYSKNELMRKIKALCDSYYVSYINNDAANFHAASHMLDAISGIVKDKYPNVDDYINYCMVESLNTILNEKIPRKYLLFHPEAMGIDVSFNGNLFEAIAKSETEREIVRINPAYDRRQ